MSKFHFVYDVVAAIVLLVGFARVLVISRFSVVAAFKAARAEQKMERMIGVVRKCGLRFYYNINQSVTAVTTVAAYTAGFNNVDRAKFVDLRRLRQAETSVSYALPTFTFVDREGDQRSYHTGSRVDLDSLLDSAIRDITGEGYEDLSTDQIGQVKDSILVRAMELFVPFSGSPSRLDAQREFYGSSTYAEAERVICSQ